MSGLSQEKRGINFLCLPNFDVVFYLHLYILVVKYRLQILDLLTGYLGELGLAGESAAEFLSLYQNLLQQPPWKQYLALKGLLLQIAELLTKEIQELHRLEDTTLTSDLAQGRES